MLALAQCALAGCANSHLVEESTEEVPPRSSRSLEVGEGEFSVVIIPESQELAGYDPEAFVRQLGWVAENAGRYRVVFVNHLGNVVEYANREHEWLDVYAAFRQLEDAGVPYGVVVGDRDVMHDGMRFDAEHDASCANYREVDCGATSFQRILGGQRGEQGTWSLGRSPSGLSSAQRINVDGLSLLFVQLAHDVPANDAAWADEVIAAHPDALVHVATHRYLRDGGRCGARDYSASGERPLYRDAISADQLFEGLVATHRNVWMVHSGDEPGEYRQVSSNRAGLPVHELMFSFDGTPDQGEGWVQLLRFDPASQRVDVFTVSTRDGRVREHRSDDAGAPQNSTFSLDLDLVAYTSR